MKPSEQQVGGSHYRNFAIQPSEFIHRNGIGFLVGNIIKYCCRYKAKNGKDDLLKARHYLDLLMEWEYPEAKSSNILEPKAPHLWKCPQCGAVGYQSSHICPG